MGREFLARCKKCGEEFTVREGGGRDSYLLYCDTCGKAKVIMQWELDENLPIIDSSGLPYNKRVEKYAGSCGDGNYKIDAKPRCPKCNSDEYEMVSEDGKVSIAYYD